MSSTHSDQISLETAPEVLRDNKAFVLGEIDRRGNVLEYAAKRLRADRDVVLVAVKRWPANLRYASPELQDDREIVIEAVSRVGFALQFASKALRSDREIVKAALRTDPRFLIDTPKNLLPGVVKLLENKGEILGYASEELQGSRELIALAAEP
jgi:hypothetical protein|tara:strand:+ start:2133 stop:2594 length:462 start_codon:yes stop_codon:yes gene_type:complete